MLASCCRGVVKVVVIVDGISRFLGALPSKDKNDRVRDLLSLKRVPFGEFALPSFVSSGTAVAVE